MKLKQLIDDKKYKCHSYTNSKYSQKMIVNEGEYYIICPRCGSNNLRHTNWCDEDEVLRMTCGTCGFSDISDNFDLSELKK